MNALSIKVRLWANHILALWYYWMGAAHRHWANSNGDVAGYERAVRDFDRALALDPNMAHVYLERGILAWRELDHPRRAILDLNKALSLDTALYEALFNRALAHQQLREYAEALADFQAYLALGEHPYWREYAERMALELQEWVVEAER